MLWLCLAVYQGPRCNIIGLHVQDGRPRHDTISCMWRGRAHLATMGWESSMVMCALSTFARAANEPACPHANSVSQTRFLYTCATWTMKLRTGRLQSDTLLHQPTGQLNSAEHNQSNGREWLACLLCLSAESMCGWPQSDEQRNHSPNQPVILVGSMPAQPQRLQKFTSSSL